jgi:hypothetical protein
VKGDPADIRREILDQLDQARAERMALVRETALKLDRWLRLWDAGELDDDELRALVAARRRVVRQHLNTLDIETRRRVERVALGALRLVATRLLGRIA